MNTRAFGAFEYAVALLATTLTLGCSGCALREPRPLVVQVNYAAQAALYNLYAATTGSGEGPEVGLCAVGHIIGSVVYVTSVAVPFYQHGNTRTSIRMLSCEGVDGVVGRIHFHPDMGPNFPCRRSFVDEATHVRSGYAADIVWCSRGKYRWYSRTGSQGGRD